MATSDDFAPIEICPNALVAETRSRRPMRFVRGAEGADHFLNDGPVDDPARGAGGLYPALGPPAGLAAMAEDHLARLEPRFRPAIAS